MKVIQTLYRDYLFRSRLEARWAVFFDALQEKWDYELEGYDLDDGDKYLPDFWLPRLNTFVEIKGGKPTDDEIRKCRKLQYFTGASVVICHGLPMENDAMWFCWDTGDSGGGISEWVMQWGWYNQLMFVLQDIYAQDKCFYVKEWTEIVHVDVDPTLRDFLRPAAACAKQARFEHGQIPELCELPPSRHLIQWHIDYDNLPF